MPLAMRKLDKREIMAAPNNKKPAGKAAKVPAKAVKPVVAPKPIAKPVVNTARAKHVAPGKATAAAILGYQPSGRGNNSVPTAWRSQQRHIRAEWRKYYTILLGLRERLLHQMSGLTKESAEEMSSYSMHMADSGTDNFDRDFALSLLSSDQDAVYEIEEALKRIERDAYGVCELTAKSIPKARLDAIPWTRFTVEAQARLERDGALRQRRLGALGSIDGVSGSSDSDEGSEGGEEATEKPSQSEKE